MKKSSGSGTRENFKREQAGRLKSRVNTLFPERKKGGSLRLKFPIYFSQSSGIFLFLAVVVSIYSKLSSVWVCSPIFTPTWNHLILQGVDTESCFHLFNRCGDGTWSSVSALHTGSFSFSCLLKKGLDFNVWR